MPQHPPPSKLVALVTGGSRGIGGVIDVNGASYLRT
jgi:hypothetical protein